MPRAAVVAFALILRCALSTPINTVEVSSHGSLVEGDQKRSKLMRRVGEPTLYDSRHPQPEATVVAALAADTTDSIQAANDDSSAKDDKGREGKGRKGKGRKGKGRKGKGRKGKGDKGGGEGNGRNGKGGGGAKDIDQILGDDEAKEEEKHQAETVAPPATDEPPVGPLSHHNAKENKVPAPSPSSHNATASSALVPPAPSPSPLPPQPEDDNLCKEVKGVKVKDTRENKEPEWAGVSLIRHGEKKECGNAMFLGEFPNGRLEACASAVATNASCSNNFQMHKDTYNCACVTSWDVCESKKHTATCLYELNPGEFANATENSGNMEDEHKHGEAKVDRGDDADEADGSDQPAPGHFGKSEADGDDDDDDKDED